MQELQATWTALALGGPIIVPSSLLAVSACAVTLEQAFEEQRKIKLPAKGGDQPSRDFGALPPRLKELILESVKLQERIVRLDQMLGLEPAQAPGEADHPLSMQLSRLREAFGTDGD